MDDSHAARTPRTLIGFLAIAASLVVGSAASGCYAGYGAEPVYAQPTVVQTQPQVQVGVAGPVGEAVVEPQLVTVAPSVQVIADYNEPIFYTGGYYWRETGSGWYRSTSYNTGFSYYNDAPYSLRSINNRTSYRNYRPAGYTPRYSYTNRGYDNRGYDRGYQVPHTQTVRDNRGYGNGGYQQPTRAGYNNGGYNNDPIVRDHRTGYDAPRQQGYTPRGNYTAPRSNYTAPRSNYTAPRSNYTAPRTTTAPRATTAPRTAPRATTTRRR